MPGKILIADDDPVARTILTDILTMAGYCVESADSGHAILEILHSQTSSNTLPDAIFLDVMLGDMTGVDVLRTFRSENPYSIIPIIFISAHAQIEVEALHGDESCDYYIEKPFTSKTILPILERIFGNN